mmetsp:Transcript_26130/g.51293  ORF Transcript_26130/g.51293 Transcript_26130/m.51293 type:complete len:108 (-) Transcript_26130:2108-2431(-)
MHPCIRQPNRPTKSQPSHKVSQATSLSAYLLLSLFENQPPLPRPSCVRVLSLSLAFGWDVRRKRQEGSETWACPLSSVFRLFPPYGMIRQRNFEAGRQTERETDRRI